MKQTNLTNTEISVNLTYNDKKYFFNTEAVKSETISVSDTNPGDIFSVIPVIGRATGPILQAAYGRTEYQNISTRSSIPWMKTESWASCNKH